MLLLFRKSKRWRTTSLAFIMLSALCYVILFGNKKNIMFDAVDDAQTHIHKRISKEFRRTESENEFISSFKKAEKPPVPIADDPVNSVDQKKSGDNTRNLRPAVSQAIHLPEKVPLWTGISLDSNKQTLNKTKSQDTQRTNNSNSRTQTLQDPPAQELSLKLKAGNVNDQNGTVIQRINYRDCATAKVMPRYTYPEYTAVVSAHGSGNTWIRYLLERVTGVATGSFYHDPTLHNGGFIGEMTNPRDRNTIAIKTHHPFQRKDINFTNAIVLVRDVFDVVIAERNRLKSRNGHVKVVSDSHFRGSDWERFAYGHSRYWEHSCRECVTIPNYLIVYYSDLQSNLEHQLRRMLKFLKVEPIEKRLACTLAYPTGRFKRTKKAREFNPFSQELTEAHNGHIRNVTALFRSLDIAPLPFGEREYQP